MNPISVFFCDEVIFQLNTSVKATWAPKCLRFVLPGNLSREKIIQISAIEPQSGDNFHLWMPKTTKVTFEIFVSELSKAFADDSIVLITDNASWHDIESPCDNVELMKLPPYSPNLNPIERLWKWIRDHYLHNQFFEKIDELEQTLIEFLQKESLLKETIQSVCAIN